MTELEEHEKLFKEALRYYNNSYDLDRIEKSLPIFRELTELGHAGGTYYLGCLYKTGQGVEEKDEEKAIELYTYAAENGYADAQYQAGYYYYFGWEVKDLLGDTDIGPDQNRGLEFWRKAAEQGHTEAQDQLYILGISTSKMSKKEQKELYKKAKELFYDENEDAIPLFQKLAEQGHAEAQYQLADCYDEGIGVDEDKVKAAEWWIKAAEQGHADSQFQAGRCLFRGIGIAEDKTAGIKWLKKAEKP
jgi:TPR repeat protein